MFSYLSFCEKKSICWVNVLEIQKSTSVSLINMEEDKRANWSQILLKKSILKTKDSWTKFKKVVLVHAVRYEKELTYQDTIRDIKDQYSDRFIYISYVSREETNTSLRGRIPKDIGNGVLEKEANIQMNPNNTHVMICGNPAMLKDTTVELKKIGLKKHRRSSPGHITTENYW